MSDRRSIGYAIAVEAQKAGAELLLTSFGRMMSITQMTAKKLNPVPDILEMDVTKPDDIAAALKETSKRWARRRVFEHEMGERGDSAARQCIFFQRVGGRISAFDARAWRITRYVGFRQFNASLAEI